jgi:L-alanine-DL-glutamate epimerase-like enolase superfamily enzyme
MKGRKAMSHTRRSFLSAVVAGSAASVFLPRVGGAGESPDHAVLGRSPLYRIPEVLRAKSGLKIRSVETLTKDANVSVVRVRTDDGSEGYGQLSTFDADLTAQIMHRKVAPLALGQDPADLDTLVDRCIEANYKFPWSFVCRALSGLDTAIWDLLGKRAGKSVCELLGGQSRPFPVYGSSMSRDIQPLEEAARLARLRDQFGYRAFKIRVGSVNGHDQDQWPGRTESLIPAVRQGVGQDIQLLADGNSCYTPPRAMEVGRLLEEHGYCQFEEPCPYWELEWTAEVAAALKIPISGGEQDNDLAQWRRMVTMRAVDVVQPDILYVGGVVRTLRVAAMAAARNMPCVPHSANLALVTLFSLHVMGAIPNAGPFVEFSIEDTPWAANYYDPVPKVVDGHVAIPDGPGWGVRIRDDWLAQTKRQITE